MDVYDTSAESLRLRVERIAEQVSQRLQQAPGGAEPFFIGDIVNAVENVAGDVANVAGDVVNAAVNATQDVVNAVGNIGQATVNATENVVNVVTDHTQAVLQGIGVAHEALTVLADFAGILPFAEGEQTTGTGAAGSQGGAKASATELIQARRAVIQAQKKALVNNTIAKRVEIKAKIAAAATRIAASRSSST